MGCSYKNRVLDYLKGKNEDPDIEKHIENCPECSALVEGYLEKEKELVMKVRTIKCKSRLCVMKKARDGL